MANQSVGHKTVGLFFLGVLSAMLSVVVVMYTMMTLLITHLLAVKVACSTRLLLIIIILMTIISLLSIFIDFWVQIVFTNVFESDVIPSQVTIQL